MHLAPSNKGGAVVGAPRPDFGSRCREARIESAASWAHGPRRVPMFWSSPQRRDGEEAPRVATIHEPLSPTAPRALRSKEEWSAAARCATGRARGSKRGDALTLSSRVSSHTRSRRRSSRSSTPREKIGDPRLPVGTDRKSAVVVVGVCRPLPHRDRLCDASTVEKAPSQADSRSPSQADPPVAVANRARGLIEPHRRGLEHV